MLKVYEDLCQKEPSTDIFVWIICTRDLSNVSPEAHKRICMSAQQRNYNQRHSYSDRGYLKVAHSFLKKVKSDLKKGQTARSFSVKREEIETKGDFPSTYHFIVCEFSKTT
jgi:hypothetical protein